MKAAEITIEQMGFSGDVKNFRMRIDSLPQSSYMMISDIRSKHLRKLFAFKGIIRQKSDVRPQTTSAKFECPSCGNVLSTLQLDTQFKEPTRCGCGRKGKFRLLSKELIDAQGIVLEESPETLEGGQQPKRMNVFLKDDLVSPISERKTNPGCKVTVVGVITEIPMVLKSGAKSTRSDLLIEANNIIISEESFIDLKILPEEEQEILKLAKDPQLYDKMINSIAPSIYGYLNIKEALVFQLFGGVPKKRKDGSSVRGDFHILLVGDPGSGKSQILKRINIVAPKGRYISGKGISAAGLTAAVVKDEFLRGWSLEAGAMVLATNGICCIDEMDKMSQEDTSALHEGLENQTISISKANIQATLIAKTTVLAAANPKLGRFSAYDTIGKQINMSPTLINRFDLIFPFQDIPNKKNDKELGNFILDQHIGEQETQPVIKTELLRKYIAYAKQKCKPKFTYDSKTEILDYYLHLRNKYEKDKSIPISPRQLEALVRLSEASAKLRLSDSVTSEDAKRAIKLLHFCLKEIGVDPETGRIDIDIISTGVASSQRLLINEVKEIINNLTETIGRTIPIEDIIASAKIKGINDAKVEEILQNLKKQGDIFEPRYGLIQKL